MTQISWLAAGAAAGWGAVRLAGADRLRALEAPAVPLLSFTPQAAAAVLLGSLLLRPEGAAATAALAGSVLAAAVVPRALRSPQPRADGPVLRLLTANLLAGRACADAVVSLVRHTDADVLNVQELTAEAVSKLRQAGLNDLLGHEVIGGPGISRAGSAIFARYPLHSGLQFRQPATAQLSARLELPAGRCADLVCVHLHAPDKLMARWKVARWREELAALPPPADPPRVLAGDFNATADHGQFRRLLRLGHVDAAAQMGSGLIPTWGPHGRAALLTIDHVLVDSRCAVLAAAVHPLPGTDHRAVYTEFRLPG